MDVPISNLSAMEVTSPSAGETSGRAGPGADNPEMQAAFESLMASMMVALAGGAGPPPTHHQSTTAPLSATDSPALPSSASGFTNGNGPDGGRIDGPDLGMALRASGGLSDLPSALAAAKPLPLPATADSPLARFLSGGENATPQPSALQLALRAQDFLAQGQVPRSVAQATQTAPYAVMQAQTQPGTPASVSMLQAQNASAVPGTQTAQVNQEGSLVATVERPATIPHTHKGEGETLFAQTGNAAAVAATAAASTKGTAPATPPSEAPATPLQQIAEQVQVSLARGEKSATIRLQPEELGSVRIRLQMQDGQLHLSIEAEQQKTNSLIHQKIADLRHNLENQGIKLGDLAVVNGRAIAGTEATQREVAAQIRTTQMDSGSNFQQQSQPQQQQAAFAGQEQAMDQNHAHHYGPSTPQLSPGSAGGAAQQPSAVDRAALFVRGADLGGVDYYA